MVIAKQDPTKNTKGTRNIDNKINWCLVESFEFESTILKLCRFAI